MPRNIYLAASWKNVHYDRVLGLLQAQGHTVYDYRTAVQKIVWTDLDPSASMWRPAKARMALQSYAKADTTFKGDYDALVACDTCVILYPSGKSAHLEAGFAKGHGAYVVAYVDGSHIGPIELMLKMVDQIVVADHELLEALRS